MGGQLITVKHGPLEYSLPHICRHSPDGFQWGYGGSGPADAALSILTDCIGTEEANKYYQYFKDDFIAGAGRELKITEEQIMVWIIRLARKLDPKGFVLEKWLSKNKYGVKNGR